MSNEISKLIYEKLEEAKKISALDPYKSYEISNEAYNIAVNNNLKIEQGYSLIKMAQACRVRSEINLMLDFSLKALELFEVEKEFNGQILALNIIGIAYFYNSKYEEALKYFFNSKELFNNFEDDYLLSCVLNNIGEVYRESESYDISIEYYKQALEICNENYFKLNTASLYSNMGEVYFQAKSYYNALDYFNKSYKILLDEKDMVTLGEVEDKLGKTYFALEKYSVAEEYYYKSLNRLKEVNNKYYIIDVLIDIGILYLHKDLNQSALYYEKALEIAIDIGSNKKIRIIYKLISEYYEKIQDYKSALVYYKYFSRINEVISAAETGDKLEILKIEMQYFKDNDKFEIIKNKLEREILNQKNEIEKIKKASKELQQSALEDELTGIPNRRYINCYLKKLLENSTDEIAVLYMIDIDNFKKYNDYWGHSKGDECLKTISNCIKEIQEKRNDVFGRYGGEEFVYVARNINYEESIELGNIIRSSVENLGIYYNHEGVKELITISIGGSLFKIRDFKSISNIMETSDNQLYKAKNMGRNKVLMTEL